ncbi:hypothetical protein [Variovorax sp. 770b2]|uniref:hypothetical protein n=1 Tax=Variovorax sp. 770b2 TaxID=1566271 RepID=UPI0008EF89D6|nr:hypothetical protein [Variovorax sp. 770b2]SFP34551.1 hypothetical protein SAMN03159339_1840 [Variovorax sp. 770b2]
MPRGIPNPNPMYGIYGYGDHWSVDIRRDKVRMVKAFYFNPCGGRGGALAQAQAWRDRLVQAHPPALKREIAVRVRRDNKSGVAGVYFREGTGGKNAMWIAMTRVSPEKSVSKAFSVGRYGPRAKELAIAERQKQLAQMTGYASRHPADGAEGADAVAGMSGVAVARMSARMSARAAA